MNEGVALEEAICDYSIIENTQLNQNYKILSSISMSDLSIVYIAQVIESGVNVIIKEFYPQSLVIRDLDKKTLLCRYSSNKKKLHELKQSFLSEANILKQLAHPNIVRYIEHFEENETVYLVMEYCQGETLDQYIKNQAPLIFSDFLKKTILPLLRTLQFVHEQGMIHRDIKPKNIMIEKDGNPKILDFGSAIRMETDTCNLIFTTKGYSPLEFYSYQSKQGTYSDIYSVAAILYYTLSGKTPVDAPSRVIEDKIEPLNSLNHEVSSWFSKKLMKSLSVHYQDRPSSLTSLIKVIKIEYVFLIIKKIFKNPKSCS